MAPVRCPFSRLAVLHGDPRTPLSYKQTPPPLDLSTLLQFRSALHGIPKPGNERQLSDILSVSQVSVRANRQNFLSRGNCYTFPLI